jgi:cyclopropane fatty-acyl-phospholipid synthase-like methyltransferase
MSDLFKDYDDYVQAQIKRARKTMFQTSDHEARREFIYKTMVEQGVSGESVLCVGARDGSEVKFFEEKKFSSVVGIDLFESKQIICCDMSKMTEHPKLKKKFDIIISIESIEHCLDIDGFIHGLNALCKRYFVCMCPVIRVPSQWDCGSLPFMLDLKSVSDLKVKLENYFTDFSVVHCDMQKKGKRLFFILKKKNYIE